MGCGGSSAAASQDPQPRAQPSNDAVLVPGQCATIRNCPNARLNGQQVILQELNDLGEWTVKGDKFPLSVGMSLGAQYLEVAQPAPTLLSGGCCAENKAMVEYVDTDGDTVVFKRGNFGIDYHVNDVLRVHTLTKFQVRDRTIFLDGTSAGSWDSSRCTTVPRGEEYILKQAEALFASRVVG